MEGAISFENSLEQLPEVSFTEPHVTFNSKINPIFESELLDFNGEKVGRIEFSLNNKSRIMIVQRITIDKPRSGYGASTYKTLQNMYPDYRLMSSDNMVKDPLEEKPNEIYLWEKLVRLGYAEEYEKGKFRMKS